ncbi:MAG: ABC transporter substrate-binding protein [Alphaproteobacteria bacterium]
MLTRRFFLNGFASVVLAAGLTAPVHAEVSADSAVAFIKDLSENAVVLLTGKQMDEKERERRFRDLFQSSFDVGTTAKLVLGRNWQRATDAERTEFLKLFEDFVTNAYLDRFREFSGEKLEVADAKPLETSDMIMVNSQILRPSGAPIRVGWVLQQKNSNYRIIDILAEGTSLAKTHREEFQAVINNSGGKIEGLLVALRKKNQKLTNK